MVYIFLGEGFEEMEAIIPGDVLRRAGIPVAYVSLGQKAVTGSHGITLQADMTLEEMDLSQAEMVVLPGGRKGVESIESCPGAMEAVEKAWKAGKFVAAVCAAPTILAHLHITDGKSVTCYPEDRWTGQMTGARYEEKAVVRDGHVITGASAGCTLPFALELVRALRGQDAAERVQQGLVLR